MTIAGMASNEIIGDDDSVAELLAKEAKEASRKYSQLGLQALLPRRSGSSVYTLHSAVN